MHDGVARWYVVGPWSELLAVSGWRWQLADGANWTLNFEG